MAEHTYTIDGKWRLGWEFKLPSENVVLIRPLDVAQLLKKRKTLPQNLMLVVERLFDNKPVAENEDEANQMAADALEGIDRFDLMTHDRQYCEALTSLMWVYPRIGEETDLEKGVIALDDVPLDDLRFTRDLAFKTVQELRFLSDQQSSGVELVLGRQSQQSPAVTGDQPDGDGATSDGDGS